MRFVFGLLGLLSLLLAAAIIFGFVSIDQTRPAVVQAPAFRADVGSVKIGTEQKTVPVPTLEVQKADNAVDTGQ